MVVGLSMMRVMLLVLRIVVVVVSGWMCLFSIRVLRMSMMSGCVLVIVVVMLLGRCLVVRNSSGKNVLMFRLLRMNVLVY